MKEVELLGVDGTVNIMAYVQKNNPIPKTGCGRRRVSAMKMQDGPGGLSPKERVAKAQGREVGEMNRSSKFHPDNAGRGVKTAVPMKSPMKGKISPSCKARAKKKFKVWPSAYASGWGVRCTKGQLKK